jgi:hypothetical protein
MSNRWPISRGVLGLGTLAGWPRGNATARKVSDSPPCPSPTGPLIIAAANLSTATSCSSCRDAKRTGEVVAPRRPCAHERLHSEGFTSCGSTSIAETRFRLAFHAANQTGAEPSSRGAWPRIAELGIAGPAVVVLVAEDLRQQPVCLVTQSYYARTRHQQLEVVAQRSFQIADRRAIF